MNERIRQLQKQSSIEQWDPDTGCYRYILNPEKFAELIVRECCLLTEEYQHRVTFYRADETIKKHFGVEE